MAGSMGGAIDLRPDLFKQEFDPNVQLSTDPSQFLGQPLDLVTQMLLQLPQLAIKAVSDLLSDPSKLADLLLQFPNAGLDAIASWAGSIPGIGPLVQAIIGSAGNLLDLSNWFGNFELFLGGGIDFGSGGFNPITAVSSFISNMLQPSGLLATLVSGLIPGLQIPGLDASKIITGSFPLSMVTGLISALANLLPWNLFNTKAVAATNQAMSPDFSDSSIARAYATDGAYSTEQAHSGTQSWKTRAHTNGISENLVLSAAVSLTGDPYNNSPEWYKVQAGQKYYLEAWVRPHAANTVGGSLVELLAGMRDSKGVNSETFPIAQQLSGSAIVAGTFTKISGYVTVPAGHDLMLPFFKVNEVTPTGNRYYVDDLIVREETASQGIIGQLFGGTTILSTLLGGVIPGLDASKIITGAFPMSMVTNLVNYFSEIDNAISSVLTGIPFVGGFLSDAWDALTDFFDDHQATAAQASDALLGNQATRESLVGNISGQAVTNPDDSTVDATIAGQTSTIANTAAAVAQLQAVQTGGTNNGVYAIEEFEYTNTTNLDTGLWAREFLLGNSTQARITADGHTAGMAYTSGSNIEIFHHYIGPNRATLTKYQKITTTISESMVSNDFFGGDCALHFYCRVSADGTKFVRAEWHTNGTVQFQYRNGGAVTNLGSANFAPVQRPPVGSNVSIEAGTAGGLNVYRLSIGGQTVHTVTDSGNVADQNQLEGGFGQRYGDRLPGRITSWAISDNAPNPVIAGSFRATRNSIVGVSSANSGNPRKFANVFDTPAYLANDLAWDPATSKITVSRAGIYMVSARTQWTAPGVSNTNYELVLYKNNVVDQRMPGGWSVQNITGFEGPQSQNYVGGHALISLLANDYVELGMVGGDVFVQGEGTNTQTHMTLAKVA